MRQKLELTCIGKDVRPRLGSRILLCDPEKTYHSEHRAISADSFNSQLIW